MSTKTACYKDMRVQVNTSYCNPRSRPATGLVPCNTQPCPARWDLQGKHNFRTNPRNTYLDSWIRSPLTMAYWSCLDEYIWNESGPYSLPDSTNLSFSLFTLHRLCNSQKHSAVIVWHCADVWMYHHETSHGNEKIRMEGVLGHQGGHVISILTTYQLFHLFPSFIFAFL